MHPQRVMVDITKSGTSRNIIGTHDHYTNGWILKWGLVGAITVEQIIDLDSVLVLMKKEQGSTYLLTYIATKNVYSILIYNKGEGWVAAHIITIIEV